MLEDQAHLVQAAHLARMEALSQEGPLSKPYQKATDIYQSELSRYNQLELQYRSSRFDTEMAQLNGAIKNRFNQIRAGLDQIGIPKQTQPFDGEIIDIEPYHPPTHPPISYQPLPTEEPPLQLPGNVQRMIEDGEKALEQLLGQVFPQLPNSRE